MHFEWMSGRMRITGRSSIFAYVKKKYGTEPEYLWVKYPDYAVLRHGSNAKWYAVVMNVSGQKLGLSRAETKDILVVKCDPILIGSLLQNDGYLPAYHMNKSTWITILLDGTVPMADIAKWIDLSYDLTKKKR
jgi:mmcQ family protein